LIILTGLVLLISAINLDARYKRDYVITESELTELIERVKKLQAIAELICKERIASF
jgi:hypothetical protein